VEQLIVRMAEENRTWGYRRIQGALANLGHHVDAITVRNILRRHHLEPAPQRRKARISWQQFLKIHWDVLAATDFCTVEVATWHGLVTYDVLVVMELSTRRVHMAGITPHSTDAFMMPCAQQLTNRFDGFLLDTRYLLHDRDAKFVHDFDRILGASGVEPVVLPPQSPDLKVHCERLVRSIREEAAQSDDRDWRGVAPRCHPVVPDPLPSREKSPRFWEPAHCPSVPPGESTWVRSASTPTRWVLGYYHREAA
jgi:putative transposase